MKRKKSSKLYEFLETSGALNTDDRQVIEAAKRRYWSKVKMEWNKLKRQRSKSYTVYFDNMEAKAMIGAATLHHTSVTNFIKQSALAVASRGRYTDAATLGEVRQLLIVHYHELAAYAKATKLPQEQEQKFLERAEALETKIMELLGKK